LFEVKNPLTIAKSGKPVVKVVPYSFKEPKKQRIGFLKGKISIPADFDSMGKNEIENIFSSSTSGKSYFADLR